MAKILQFLTLARVEKLDACHEAVEAFGELFGNRGSIPEVILWLREIEKDDWEAWVLAQDPELTRAFLFHGADVHICNNEALQEASSEGRTKVVKLLLEAGADVHGNGDEALHQASSEGHTKTVKLLLEADADVHAHNNDALSEASCWGHIEVVKLLLEAGADVHANDDEALHRALHRRHTEVVELLDGAMETSSVPTSS